MASSLKRTISGVWTYFTIDELDDSIAVCNIEKCSAKSRRVRRASSDAEKKTYLTKGLWTRLNSHHHDEYKQASEVKKAEQDKKRLKLSNEEKHNEIYSIATSMNMTKQLTFQQTFDRQKKWTEHHPEQQTITFRLAEWICNAMLPYTIVEDDRFKVLINQLNPRFVIPNKNKLRQKSFQILVYTNEYTNI